MAAAVTAEVSDEQLVLGVAAGRVGAFADLVRRYNPRLLRVVRRVLRDKAEAEDVCQETWLRAHHHLGSLLCGAAFSSWLCQIGLCCALEPVHRERRSDSLDELDRRTPPTDECGPESHLVTRRLGQTISSAIDELSPRNRSVVLLCDVDQLSTHDVALALGVRDQNVRVRLHRAHARLRRQLGAEADDAFRVDDAALTTTAGMRRGRRAPVTTSAKVAARPSWK